MSLLHLKMSKPIDEQIINETYKKMLGRQASEAEIKLYISNKINFGELIEIVLNSDEYKQHTSTIVNAADINSVFEKLLKRQASESEIELFISKEINLGKLIEIVWDSDEYKSSSEENISDIKINKVFETFLKRQASAAEITTFKSKKVTLDQLIEIVLNSDEYNEMQKNEKISLKQMDDIFEFLLGRSFSKYEAELFANETIESLYKNLCNSQEYKERQKEIKDVYCDQYAATSYYVNWEKPSIFTCVYNCQFKDTITENLRKKLRFFWQDQYEALKLFPERGYFLDIGANIGVITSLFASRGWSGYSIEASERNVQCIQKTIALNNLNVQVGSFAVTDKTKTIRFLENGPWGAIENDISNKNNNIVDRTFENIEYKDVKGYALDDWKLTSMNSIEKIDFIKMDIEGAEVNALQGMKHFLDNFNYPPFFCECNGEALFHFSYTTKDLFNVFYSIGYRPYVFRDGYLYEYDTTQFSTDYCTDYFFLHHIPSYLEKHISKDIYKVNEQSIEKSIINMLQGINGQIVHTCSELKNFNNYLSNNEILNLLNKLKSAHTDDAIFKALEWFNPVDYKI